jgi:hypothetical protein
MRVRAAFSPFRISVAAAFACVAPSAGPAALLAQTAGEGASVVSRDRAEQVIEPGGRVTLVFMMHASAAAALTGTGRVTVPAGWSALAPARGVQLEAGGSVPRPVLVEAPTGVAPGRYLVHYRVATYAGTLADSAVLRVEALRRLDARLLDMPAALVAGRDQSATFVVANRGNSVERVMLSVETTAGLEVELAEDLVELRPGESRAVRLRLRPANGRSAMAGRRRLVLLARAMGGTGEPSARGTATVDVVATRGAGAGAPALPATLMVRAAGHNDGGTAVAFDAAGDVRGTRIDARVRTAPEPGGRFGATDEYRLTVRGRRYTLRAGDHPFAASRLISGQGASTGAGLDLRVGVLDFSGSVHTDRRRPERELVRSMRVAVNVGSAGTTFRLGAGWAEATHLPDAGYVTAFSSFRAGRAFVLDGDAARPATGGDPAFAVQSRISAGPLQATGYAVRKPLDFPDGQAGLEHYRGTGTMRLSRWLRAGTTFEHTVTPPALASFHPAGTEQTTFTAFAVAGPLGLEYRNTAFDRPHHGDIVADVLRGTFNVRRGGATLGARGEYGWIETGAAPASYWLAGFDASVLLARGLILRAGTERREGTHLSSLIHRGSWAGHGALDYRLDGGFRLRLRGALNHEVALPMTRLVLDAVAEVPFAMGHRLQFRARSSGEIGWMEPSTSALQLSYIIPLRIPTGGARGARISGRVSDAATGAAYSDALVQVGGRTVLTDRHGRFELHGMANGAHDVHIVGLAAGSVREAVTPGVIQVLDGRNVFADFAVRRQAVIRGTVRRWAADPRAPTAAVTDGTAATGGERTVVTGAGAVVDVAPVAGAVIAATCGHHGATAVADALGRFVLAGLPPGECSVRVQRAAIPARHALEQDAFTVMLSDGGDADVVFRVLPQVQTIRILNGADVTLELQDLARPLGRP